MAMNAKRVYGLLLNSSSSISDDAKRRKTSRHSSSRVEEDLFGKLPDEIIVLILSRLERIEDRAVSSALSRRWRYLWKHAANTNLSFTTDVVLGPSSDYVKQFVHRNDQVVNSFSRCDDGDNYSSSILVDSFNLSFAMKVDDGDNINYHRHIDRWLSFALHNKVKHVKLDFTPHSGPGVYSIIHSPLLQSVHLGSLTSLVLSGLKVPGEIIEYILATAAPLLEQLSVTWYWPSQSPGSFTVAGPSLKLKHLKVCGKLERLYIHDVVNLESLVYRGDAKSLTIKNAPRLVKATYTTVHDGVPQLLTRLPPHLEKLALTLVRYRTLGLASQFPRLRNLRQLELVLDPHAPCSRLSALLLDASPILHQLKIEFRSFADQEEEVQPPLGHPHKSLKVLELVGFVGCKVHLGVADYIIQNTNSLQQITVDTHHPFRPPSPGKQQAARQLAKTHLRTALAASSSSCARLLVK